MTGLIDHFEQHLGPIESGWSTDADGGPMPFQVVRFDEAPSPEMVAFATIGMSRHGLHSSRSNRSIHCELIMLVDRRWRNGPLPGILQHVGSRLLTTHHALLRGEVVGPNGPLVDGSQLEALYAAIPVYLPDSFATCEVDGEQIVMIWLVPISAGEAAYIARSGWNAFEDVLSERDVDLTDLHRDALTFDKQK